ncbi:hypothetical protein PR202_gb28220 [Eleusine coracana subsp. coracana]|uniref:Protein FAR1-RELATED SEQUENCE n=1 Tax=Eleusine coracana subsp. coracana TaxID=191504 RepID=A0AAV5FVS9_ELECO|nr:hypothetical protein PR202_gb28220 [Eleusine coracana subsp. coracana]
MHFHSCRKLECESIPCQHICLVLQFLDLDKIPQCCIMRRWTTKAKCAFPSDRYGEIYSWYDQMESYRQLRSMGSEAFFKASMSKETVIKVKLFLQEILNEDDGENDKKDATLYGRVLSQARQCMDPCSEEILDPVNIIPKGAPTKRLRSCMEKKKRAKT